MISLNTNISAMNSTRLLNVTNDKLEKTTERLSSGMRINRAADDASGLFIAESLTTQIRGASAAIGNIQQASSLAQIADQGLATITDALQRMRELAVAQSSGLLDADQRTAIEAEYVALRDATQDVLDNTTWGATEVLTGTFAAATLQVGPNTAALATLDVADFSTAVVAQATLADQAEAATAIGQIDTALTLVNAGRSTVGAQMASLEYTKNALEVGIVANSDARSRIRDADVAAEVSNLVRTQIQQQAGASALSAANFSAQFVLSLLQ
jgi:flagellin